MWNIERFLFLFQDFSLLKCSSSLHPHIEKLWCRDNKDLLYRPERRMDRSKWGQGDDNIFKDQAGKQSWGAACVQFCAATEHLFPYPVQRLLQPVQWGYLELGQLNRWCRTNQAHVQLFKAGMGVGMRRRPLLLYLPHSQPEPAYAPKCPLPHLHSTHPCAALLATGQDAVPVGQCRSSPWSGLLVSC